MRTWFPLWQLLFVTSYARAALPQACPLSDQEQCVLLRLPGSRQCLGMPPSMRQFVFERLAAGAVIEDNKDPRIKAAIMQCPSLMSAGGRLGDKRQNKDTPVMLMAGVEDTVIGEKGAELIRQYAASHRGPICLMEIKGGGHVSFTSCNLYNKEYGNGIGKSKSLTQPGQMYDPLPIQEQHAIINSYGLAFLDRYLRDGGSKSEEFLKANQYGDKILYKARL
eukprot:TRINITY_DN31588_c0_g1_i1.p1 TRINITY_DN31588_c0_g1~~TRINITY_DN31588_c0_g1_i1.p1  ORF type:complete len:222 (-),score=38.95 TRINITY_DN31588_c0_g1_i1:397-1062(-)